MLQNGQMIDLGETFDQIYDKLSLELNMIETNQFFLQKNRVNKIELVIRTNGIGKCQKGGQLQEVPYHLQVWECPLPYTYYIK